MNKVSAVIPAYNEEKTISKTITALKNIPEISEIILVDDGSDDKTSDVAENFDVKVIKLKKNLGKGSALNIGIKESNFNIILMIDADLEESASEARKLILPIIENKADVAIAKFPKSKIKAGFGLTKGFSRWVIKKFTQLEMASPLSGQRCFKREVFEKIGKIAGGFGAETAFTIDAARHGFTIIEIETNMKHKETGRTLKDFLHRGKQFIAVARVLIERMLWMK